MPQRAHISSRPARCAVAGGSSAPDPKSGAPMLSSTTLPGVNYPELLKIIVGRQPL